MSTETQSVGARGPVRPASSERHVYEPHKAGMPPLGPYLADVWRRREFVVELARNNLRAQHFNTVFGVAWLVINPLLQAGAYFVLVDILRHRTNPTEFLAHLVAAVFAFHFVTGCVRSSVTTVVSSGKLILNSSFPRILLPLSDVVTGFMRFLPMLAIYAILHVALGRPTNGSIVWILPIIALMVILAAGVCMLLSAVQVYFRDLKNFVPIALRLWLYVSPVLYTAWEVPHSYRLMIAVNPMGRLLSAWSDVLDRGLAPSATTMAIGAGWAVGLFVVGALFFVSREREFAVRL